MLPRHRRCRSGFLTLAVLFLIGFGCAPSLAITNEEKARADALLAGVGDHILQGHKADSLKALDEAMGIYERAGDRRGEASCHLFKGLAHLTAGESSAALAELEKSLAIREELDDRFDAWLILWMLAETEKQEGRLRKAEVRLEKALGLLQEIGQSSEPISLESMKQLVRAFGAPAGLLDMFASLGEIAKPFLLLFAGIITHDTLGGVLVDTGRLELAEHHLNQALQSASLFAGLFDSSIFAHFGDLRLRQGRLDEAKKCYEKALGGVRHFTGLPFVRDARLEVQALGRLADIESLSGRLQKALDWNDRALALVRQTKDRRREAAVLQDRAELLLRAGSLDAAETLLQEAFSIAEQSEHVYHQATILADRANLAMLRGSLEPAARYLEAAVALLRRLDEPYVAAGVWTQISAIYTLLSARGGASGTLEEAMIRTEKSEFRLAEELGKVIGAMERWQSNRQDTREIRERFAAFRKLAEEEGLRLGAEVWGLIAEMLRFVEGAEVGPDSMPESELAALAEREKLPYVPLLARFLQGRLHFQRGDLAGARELWSRVVEDACALGNKNVAASVLAVIGGTYWKEGKSNEAIEQVVLAVKLIEDDVRNYRVEELLTSYLGSEWRLFYEMLIEMLVQQGRTKEAFEYAERARARAFLNLVGNRRLRPDVGADAALVAEAETLRALITEKERQTVVSAAPYQGPEMEDVKRARRQFEHLLVRLKVSNPEYASLVAVEPVKLEEVQRELPADVTLISYFVSSLGVHAWVLDRTSFEHVPLSLGAAELRRALCWADQLGHRDGVRGAKIPDPKCDNNRATSEEIYSQLIVPLREKIVKPRLVIIPHGVLHYLPFAALRDPMTGCYLVEDYTLTYAPSASALRFLRGKETPIEGRALVLGNPATRLQPLPGAEREAARVALGLGTTPLLQQEATESVLYQLGGKIDVLHIAAHGIYDPDSPLFSCIALSPDKDQDGNLQVHEILTTLDLSGVNLVVLSACQTAIGERSGGDEIEGLTRALLYAGSPGVISTLWNIDDQAAAVLMQEFYSHFLAGAAAAEALQKAQVTLLGNPLYKDPKYWAAFSLAGDPQGLWRSPSPVLVRPAKTERKPGGSL